MAADSDIELFLPHLIRWIEFDTAEMRRRNRALAAGPGARFSNVPRTFPTRKAIRKTTTCLFCKAGLLICCKGNKNKNNCKVSCYGTPSFRRYKENYVTRNTPEKFQDFRETGPRTSDEESRARAIALDPLPIWPYTPRAMVKWRFRSLAESAY